ncbi:MAG: hypothetical protein JNL82_18375 [Myxococcales bacterium]|nr:hypothetical protein [Myxococcales bacterium]
MAAGPLALVVALVAAPGYSQPAAPPNDAGTGNAGTGNAGANNSGADNPVANNAGANSPGANNPVANNPVANNPGANNAGTNNAPTNAGASTPAPNRSTVIPATAPSHPPDPPRASPYPTTPSGSLDFTRAPPQPVVPPPVLTGPPQPPAPAPVFPPVPLDLRPPPPYGDGTGLIVGAAIAGAATLGVSAARFGLSLGEVTNRKEDTSFYLAAVATPIAVAAGVGLAAGAGHLRGRWDGYRSAFNGEPKVRASAFIQSGAVVLGMGAVGYIMAWIPWQGDGSLDSRGGGTLLVESVSSLVLMTGVGLVAYGVSWRKHATKYGYYRRLGLRPAASPTFAGLTLSGRF